MRARDAEAAAGESRAQRAQARRLGPGGRARSVAAHPTLLPRFCKPGAGTAGISGTAGNSLTLRAKDVHMHTSSQARALDQNGYLSNLP